MEELAIGEGVHPADLARNFRRFYGSSAGEYVRRVRVEAARRLIRESDELLVNIALACGFSSQSHLCTTFRRVTGFTPGSYRQQLNRFNRCQADEMM
jgi:AraC family transcriptional regulator